MTCSSFSLPTLMGSNTSFTKIIADGFPPWHCVIKHSCMFQTSNTSTFKDMAVSIEVQYI